MSEDFIILRRLWEQPFWSLAWEQISGPWMGVSLVLFWRPLSTFILQLQELLWGVQSIGYLIVMLGAHLLSTGLLFLLSRRLFPDQKWAARCVCLLFAVYPLHPNSVLFIASFATVYATSFSIASLLLFIEARRLGNRRLFLGSLLSFSFSLACYEASIILPILLISLDLFFSAERGEAFSARALVKRQIPFITLAVGYLVLRHFLLGVTIGGYSGPIFPPGTWWILLKRLQPRWSYLIVPIYSRLRPDWIELAPRLALLAALATLFFRKGARPGRFLLGLVWIMAARLPFGDTHVVPANGRYWYLASAGIGLLVVGFAELLPRPRSRRVFLGLTTILVTLAYCAGLISFSRQYIRASELAARVHSEAFTLLDPGHPDSAHFLLGIPPFITNSLRKNVARVLSWGLSDSFLPPFSDPGFRVYPLGSLQLDELGPLGERPEPTSLWRWTPKGFKKIHIEARELARIDLQDIEDPAQGLQYRAAGTMRYRMVIVGRMQTVVIPLAAGSGWQKASLPLPTITSDQHLYRDEIYIWIEGIDPKGRVLASSPLLTLSPGMTAVCSVLTSASHSGFRPVPTG